MPALHRPGPQQICGEDPKRWKGGPVNSSTTQDSTTQMEPSAERTGAAKRLVILVGSPNVGKSLLFNRLTGAYAIVSNYPGTSVEITRGKAQIDKDTWEV